MNKILPLLGAALIFSSYNSWAAPAPQPQTQTQPAEAKEEKFVNPIFYQKMYSSSRWFYETQITPTSINLMESEEFTQHYQCKLLKNEMDTVVLDCFRYDYKNDKIETTFVYTLSPCTKENLCLDDGGWLVKEQQQDKKTYLSNDQYTYFQTTNYIIPSSVRYNPDEKFVNQMFYKKLHPISRGSRPTFITPTSLTYYDLYNKPVVEKCKMIENSMMFVTLHCTYYDNELKKNTTYEVRYVLYGCDKDKEVCISGKWEVRENNRGSGVGSFSIED